MKLTSSFLKSVLIFIALSSIACDKTLDIKAEETPVYLSLINTCDDKLIHLQFEDSCDFDTINLPIGKGTASYPYFYFAKKELSARSFSVVDSFPYFAKKITIPFSKQDSISIWAYDDVNKRLDFVSAKDEFLVPVLNQDSDTNELKKASVRFFNNHLADSPLFIKINQRDSFFLNPLQLKYLLIAPGSVQVEVRDTANNVLLTQSQIEFKAYKRYDLFFHSSKSGNDSTFKSAAFPSVVAIEKSYRIPKKP